MKHTTNLHYRTYTFLFNPFTPKSDQLKCPLQPHQKYNYIPQYEELGFSSLTQKENDYTTNSHYITWTFLLKGTGRMRFLNLGVKGSKGWENVLFELRSERVQSRHYDTTPWIVQVVVSPQTVKCVASVSRASSRLLRGPSSRRWWWWLVNSTSRTFSTPRTASQSLMWRGCCSSSLWSSSLCCSWIFW